MKAQKNRKLLGTGLPGSKAISTAGPKVGTTRRTEQSRGSAGRVGRALRDSRTPDSATLPPEPQNGSPIAVARWENEGGRAVKTAVVADSPKKSAATKPVLNAPDQQAKKPVKAKVDVALDLDDTNKGPQASLLLGQDDPKRLKAESQVKDSRIKEAGLKSRLLGHVSSTVRRAQARRDSKN